MTTYDQIYTEFITNCKTDNINLPQTNEGKYAVINSAIRHFNNRMSDSLKGNNLTEMVDRDLTDDELIIIAHYLRLSFLENQLIHTSTVWSPFEKEIGVKNLRDQLAAQRELVKEEKNTIENLILFSEEDYL